MFNIVIFGPPGAGKGTQSALLVQKFNFVHISTGDILRSEIEKKTELGIEAKKLIDHGNLVSDEIAIGMIKNKLLEYTDCSGFIFDGFPRTVAQAERLDIMLKELKTNINIMIALDVAFDELVSRLLKRGKEFGRPDDQNIEIINKRFDIYKNQTSLVIPYYESRKKLKMINGTGNISDIFKTISLIIEEMNK